MASPRGLGWPGDTDLRELASVTAATIPGGVTVGLTGSPAEAVGRAEHTGRMKTADQAETAGQAGAADGAEMANQAKTTDRVKIAGGAEITGRAEIANGGEATNRVGTAEWVETTGQTGTGGGAGAPRRGRAVPHPRQPVSVGWPASVAPVRATADLLLDQSGEVTEPSGADREAGESSWRDDAGPQDAGDLSDGLASAQIRNTGEMGANDRGAPVRGENPGPKPAGGSKSGGFLSGSSRRVRQALSAAVSRETRPDNRYRAGSRPRSRPGSGAPSQPGPDRSPRGVRVMQSWPDSGKGEPVTGRGEPDQGGSTGQYRTPGYGEDGQPAASDRAPRYRENDPGSDYAADDEGYPHSDPVRSLDYPAGQPPGYRGTSQPGRYSGGGQVPGYAGGTQAPGDPGGSRSGYPAGKYPGPGRPGGRPADGSGSPRPSGYPGAGYQARSQQPGYSGTTQAPYPASGQVPGPPADKRLAAAPAPGRFGGAYPGAEPSGGYPAPERPGGDVWNRNYPAQQAPPVIVPDPGRQVADTPIARAAEAALEARGGARARPWPRPRACRMMTIANQKGGVGKTTTAVNLAAGLALHGSRVLVIDLDPQGNASTALDVEHHVGTPSVYNVLIDDQPLAEIVRPVSGFANLYCAPATIDLAGAEIELVPLVARESRLARAVAAYDSSGLDYVLIDCPPSLGLLTVNALVAGAEVLIPIQCEYYALEGLEQLLRTVELVRSHLNPGLTISTILLTMFDARTKLASQVAEEVREHFGETVLRAVIPRSVRVSEAPSYGQSVMTYDPGSSGAMAYLEASRELAYRNVGAAPGG